MYTPSYLMEQAIQRFLRDNADLLALVKNLTIDELRRKLAAAMELNPEFSSEILLHADSDYLNQSGHAGRIARESFSAAAYRGIAQSFVRVKQNCQIIFNVKWETFPEAFEQLQEIDRIAEGREPLPPPPPPKSAREVLEEQVREDWRKLPADKLKIKLQRDPQYKQVFDRLMNANQLESTCTSLHDGGAEFRQ